MASQLKFALVQWTELGEEGKMDVVDLNWVRGWESIEFDGDGKPCPSKPVVVEWRVGKADKDDGWTVYPGIIIKASRKYAYFYYLFYIFMFYHGISDAYIVRSERYACHINDKYACEYNEKIVG